MRIAFGRTPKNTFTTFMQLLKSAPIIVYGDSTYVNCILMCFDYIMLKKTNTDHKEPF
jgi:hypothetical protein